MHDLEDRIREYAGHLEDTTPWVGAETAQRITEQGRRSSRLIPAIVAAGLVVLVIAAVVILDPFGSEAPFVEEPTTLPTTTTTQPTTTTQAAPTTTTAVAAQMTMSWNRIESEAFGGAGEQGITDIVAGDAGLVAVGWDGSGADLDAAAWYSSDGGAWTKVVTDEAVFGGPGDQYMGAITTGGPGFVAVGEETTPDSLTGIAAVWTSPDGITWSRVPHDETAFGGEEQVNVFMKDVTAFGSGLVAVGLEWRGNDADAVAWTSPNGTSWERVPHDETVFGGTQDQVMWAVTPGGPGLVAVGQAGEAVGAGGPDQPAAVWVSTDGRDWSRVPEQAALLSGLSPVGPGSADWARMQDVVIGGPGLVAAGWVGKCDTRCNEDGAIWTSADGVAWERSIVEQAGGFLADRMFGVVDFGGLLVAAGEGLDTNLELGPAVVWTSTGGGDTWVRVPHSGSAFGRLNEGPNAMFGLVEFGSDLIAAGNWGSDASVWIATIEE